MALVMLYPILSLKIEIDYSGYEGMLVECGT